MDWSAEAVSDDGVVVVVFSGGERCTITMPRDAVARFRRLVEAERARARSGHERHRLRSATGRPKALSDFRFTIPP
jgi:hypothetical protein